LARGFSHERRPKPEEERELCGCEDESSEVQYQPACLAGRYLKHDVDPIVAKLQRAIEESGQSTTEVAAKALCTYQTVQRIIDGDTRLPRNTTCDRIFEACGITRTFIKNGIIW
jgi:hypothetical protein